MLKEVGEKDQKNNYKAKQGSAEAEINSNTVKKKKNKQESAAAEIYYNIVAICALYHFKFHTLRKVQQWYLHPFSDNLHKTIIDPAKLHRCNRS